MGQGVPKCSTRCPEQDMGRGVPVSNGFGTMTETFSSTISIPLAITGRRPRAGWLPALTKWYKNLPFLPVASWNPGKKTTVIWSSFGIINKKIKWCRPKTEMIKQLNEDHQERNLGRYLFVCLMLCG